MESRKPLRAAGYCRTSSEAQRGNASIPDQREGIAAACKANGWPFVGFYVDESKSGSTIAGRTEFQRMMRDAAGGKFDVVVIFDITRFGRDGFDILESSRTLVREFGVHVVDARGGYDTRDPNRVELNFMQAGMAEGEKLRMLKRTKLGKIRAAREHGAPAGPERMWPFGRVWVKAEKRWAVDPEKKRIIEDCAARYVAGESFATLGDEYGLDPSGIHRVLTKRCGSEWTQRITCPELGIDETITTQIPPLLDDETVAAIRAEAEARKTWKRDQLKNRYLLGRMLFCEFCGGALSGQPDRSRLIYRHGVDSRRKHPCPSPKPRPWIDAGLLEENVIRHLYDTFGNPVALQKAIEAAIPNMKEVAAKRARLERLSDELEKVQRGRDSIMGLIASGDLSATEAKPRLAQSKEKAERLRAETDRLNEELDNVPTPADAESVARRVGAAFGEKPKRKVRERMESAREQLLGIPSARQYQRMTWEEKRALLEALFGGRAPDGSRLGVYVTWDAAGRWRFSLRGRLCDGINGKAGWLNPMPQAAWNETEPEGGRRQREAVELLAGGSLPRSSEPAVTLSQPY